jgi:hypothetical protein
MPFHHRLFVCLLVAAVAACGADPDPPAHRAQASAPGGASPAASADAGAPSASPPPRGPDGGDLSDAANAADAPSADELTAARALCVQTINQYRATLSLPPYAAWDDVDTCADGEAKSDSISGTPHSAFGTCAEHAQNECPQWPHGPGALVTPCLRDMWNEGPGSDFEAHGHYINMSSTKYTKVSCGFAKAADGRWWATQDFR